MDASPRLPVVTSNTTGPDRAPSAPMPYLTNLRPGLLVSLKTSVVGGVSYAKEDIEPDHEVETGARVARWKTERVIENPKEHEAAIKIRGKVRSLISAVCAQSAFGMLCPEARKPDLDKAISDARELADAFNDGATVTKVHVYVIAGRISPDDAEAVRAINSEMADLMTTMQRGLATLDVKTVREAATRARNVGQMLSPQARERVSKAIDAARATARKIVAAGESASVEIDQATIRTMAEARTAFLDLDDMPPADLDTPEHQAPALDLAPEGDDDESDDREDAAPAAMIPDGILDMSDAVPLVPPPVRAAAPFDF